MSLTGGAGEPTIRSMSDDGTNGADVLPRARGGSRRRWFGAFVIALVILAAVGTKLLIDWNTYTAHLGLEARPDELALVRNPAFGCFNPPGWRREIMTGFLRPQFLAAAVKNHSFAVRNALSDWKDIESQLDDQRRWALQFATWRGAADANAGAPFEAVKHPNTYLYGRADGSVADLLIGALKSGSHEAKFSAAIWLWQIGTHLPQDREVAAADALFGALRDQDAHVAGYAAYVLGITDIPRDRQAAIADALLGMLKEQDSSVRSRAAQALGGLVKNLPQDRRAAVADALFNALKDKNHAVRKSAAEGLATLGANLAQDRWPAVIDEMLAAIKNGEAFLGCCDGEAMANFWASIPPDRRPVVMDAFLAALKVRDTSLKSLLFENLGAVWANVPKERESAVVDALLAFLKEPRPEFRRFGDPDTRDRAAVAVCALSVNLPRDDQGPLIDRLFGAFKEQNHGALEALGRLGAILPPDRLHDLLDALLDSLKDHDSDLRISAGKGLESLRASIPPDQLPSVTDALLNALRDQNSDVRFPAAKILGSIGANLPQDRLAPVVDALLHALKDNYHNVKVSAVMSLEELGANLPQNRRPALIDALFTSLGNGNSEAIEPLTGLFSDIPEVRLPALAEASLQALNDQANGYPEVAAAALGRLGTHLPEDRRPALVDSLVGTLKSGHPNAAEALASLWTIVPQDRQPTVIEALLAQLNAKNSNYNDQAASALAHIEAGRISAPSVFLELDTRPHLERFEGPEGAFPALHELGSAKWPQSDGELLKELENDDSRWRVFALHVLARREPLSPGTLAQIRALRDDPRGRPWVKLAALNCLVEMESEKRAREREAEEKKKSEAAKADAAPP
jgi:HEAT repeat protein